MTIFPANESGLANRGFFVSVFSGLVLLVVSFQVLESQGIPAHIRSVVDAGTAVLILVLIVGVYKGFTGYKNYRFRKGDKDTLHLMTLMEGCLRRDIGRLARQINPEGSIGLSTMHTMLQAKLTEIVARDCRNMDNIQARYRKIRRRKKTGFEILFNTPEAYAQRALPREFDLISEAVACNYYQIESEFNDLKAARMHLFTVMGDYFSLFPPSEKNLKSIRAKYRYQPPGPMKARRIVFAVKVIAYFEDLTRSGLPHARLKNDLAKMAEERIPLISRRMAAYQTAWKNFVDAYDAMAGRSNGLDIR